MVLRYRRYFRPRVLMVFAWAIWGQVGFSGNTSVPSPPHSKKSDLECGNTGLFLVRKSRTQRQITDGTSATFAAGEVLGGDNVSGQNVWTYAFRAGSVLRSTENPLNTPVGAGKADCLYPPACWNAAFGSEHKGGGEFRVRRRACAVRQRRHRLERLSSRFNRRRPSSGHWWNRTRCELLTSRVFNPSTQILDEWLA